MFLGLLISLIVCRLKLLDSLAFAITFGYKANIVDLAATSYTITIAFNKIYIIDEIENRRDWRPL